MSKISVVIPCYNAENYIERCVNAFEMQSFKDFTLIFVDDCSSDGTVEKIRKINSGLDIALLINEQNCGPAITRNKGIQYAASEYITFCDCDDWYEPEFLSEMLLALTENDADIALCGYNVVNEKGNVQKRPLAEKNIVLTGANALRLDADSLCMLMVKTDIMKTILLPDIRNGEDVAVVPLLIAKSQRCAVLKECLYNYYRRDGSASCKPTMRVVESLQQAFVYTQKFFPDNMKSELEYLGIKNMLYSALITLFSFGYDTKTASDILNSFERIYPFWHKNPYFCNLSFYKKIVLKLLKIRCFFAVKLIAYIRGKIV